MCRYAFHSYKSHFACFPCRKAFKKTPLEDYVEHVGVKAAYKEIVAVLHCASRRREVEAKLGIWYEEIQERYLADVSVCPQCAERMAPMGLDFRPPQRRAKEAWRIICTLYEHGFAFKGCGCSVGYKPPERKVQLDGWLKQHAGQTEGERLLEAFVRRGA